MAIILAMELLAFALILAVLMVIGWILFWYLSRPHATTLNAFLFTLGTLADAYIFLVVAFDAAGLMKIIVTPDMERPFAIFSLGIGAFLGGPAVIWLRLRKKNEPKGKGPT